MNIVKRELKSNLKSTIIWSLSIIFLIFVWMIEYESFANNPQINDLMDSMPQAMLEALGMGAMTLSSLSGFISAIALYIYLLLGIHAVLLGSNIISKEERDRTAEYLFTLPVSRKQVVKSKLIAAIINVIILNFVSLSITILTSINHEKDEGFYKFIGLLFLAIFIVQMIFLSIGMLVASINKRYKKSGNISVTILFITFIISSLINIVDKVDFLKYITPFKYFDGGEILNSMKLELTFIVISIFIIAGGLVGTFIFYPKRDLYI
ncbi:MAG: ABC transporter permease subunit [Tissierella sp.]|uniref:ABC transporter permease subunit n=1 Tax=Tissierella sp. TaxID=41274 RepID=UPI003F9B03F9